MTRATARRTSFRSRRSFVIMSVFVIVLLALLMVTGMIYLAESETAARARTAAQTQARADAWSAAQVIMDELNRQRQRILNGEQPDIESQYQLYETDRALGVARLLPIGGEQRLLSPESAKLDLNEVTAEQLAATNVVDASAAQRIIDARARDFGGTFRSVGDLTRVDGLTPRTIFGPIDRALVRRQAQQNERMSGEASSAPSAGAAPTALIDVATVHGCEPALQRNGDLRINLNVEWSDELGRRVNDRFGEGSAQVLKRLFEQTTFDEDARIIEALLQFDVPTEDWAEIVDALTTESGEVHFGRVNINTASREVLAALPGIGPEQAAQIVQVREGLSAEERWTVVWPAVAGILEPDAYVQLADRITTRSWTYRLRFAVGAVSPDEPNGPIEGPAIFEMVVDLSAPQPRVAYWRDISALQTTVLVAANATASGGAEQSNSPDEAENGDSGNDAELPATASETSGSMGSAGPGAGPQPGTRGRNSSAEAGADESSTGSGVGGEGGGASPRHRVGRWLGG